MHNFLDDIVENDDTLLILGSSGGDGFGRDNQGLLRHGHHHRHQKRKRRIDDHEEGTKRVEGLGKLFDHIGGNGVGRRRRVANGAMDPSQQKMADAIANFKAKKNHDRLRRDHDGEKSVREEFEQEYGYDRLEKKLQKLRRPSPSIPSQLPYDIYKCPDNPPPNYPFVWNVVDVLANWNPDDTEMPTTVHQSLCVFDWNHDQDKAFTYRNAQVPFVIQNIPEAMKASIRWTTPNYLADLVGSEPIRNEHSTNNHFMFWKTKQPVPDFTPPTDMIDLTYPQWASRAQRLEQITSNHQDNKKDQTTQEHWYFRLNAMLEKHGYVYEELPFFDPSLGTSLTMINPPEHRGINCRFGMKGVIAESHYDSSSNFIALMGGQRRYILAHPDQCRNMELYPQGHPSGRHSAVDWSTVAQEQKDGKHLDRPFYNAQVNEVIMQAGDMMYLPTYWFHFIVSLNTNYQCNSRSGESYEYEPFITQCGFASAPRHKI